MNWLWLLGHQIHSASPLRIIVWIPCLAVSSYDLNCVSLLDFIEISMMNEWDARAHWKNSRVASRLFTGGFAGIGKLPALFGWYIRYGIWYEIGANNAANSVRSSYLRGI